MYEIVEKYISVSDHQEDQAMIRSLEFSAPIPHFRERGEGLDMELISSMPTHEAFIKIPNVQGSESFQAGEYTQVLAGRLAHLERGVAGMLHASSHITCSMHLSHPNVQLCPLSHIFYNNLVNSKSPIFLSLGNSN